jgi:hypothetical protein
MRQEVLQKKELGFAIRLKSQKENRAYLFYSYRLILHQGNLVVREKRSPTVCPVLLAGKAFCSDMMIISGLSSIIAASP